MNIRSLCGDTIDWFIQTVIFWKNRFQEIVGTFGLFHLRLLLFYISYSSYILKGVFTSSRFVLLCLTFFCCSKFHGFCEGGGLYEVTGEVDAFLVDYSVLVVNLQRIRRNSLSFLSWIAIFCIGSLGSSLDLPGDWLDLIGFWWYPGGWQTFDGSWI